MTLHVSNAKWTPSDEQEGHENGLETSQTGSITRGATFETKDNSMNHLPKTPRSGTWQRSRWAGAVTVTCTVGTALTARIGKNFDATNQVCILKIVAAKTVEPTEEFLAY